jgi:hypothetical protein
MVILHFDTLPHWKVSVRMMPQNEFRRKRPWRMLSINPTAPAAIAAG